MEESPRRDSWGEGVSVEAGEVAKVDAAIQTEDADPTSEEVAEEPESSTPEEDELWKENKEPKLEKGNSDNQMYERGKT